MYEIESTQHVCLLINRKIQQIAPGDDLILSNMYSLLNYVAAATKDIYESSANSHLMGLSQSFSSNDHATMRSMEAGLRGMSEEEKRLVGISTISIVTHLALEFNNAEVWDYLVMNIYRC